MNKADILEKIKETGIIAVVRAQSAEQAEKITDACVRGGIRAIELTFTVPNAQKLIEAIRGKYGEGDVLVGAGTVMDPATARIAILAGAQFIVSPYLNPEIVRLCSRYGVLSMPGVFTPTECVTAMECGADVIKVFPGDVATPNWIKSVLGPIPNAQLMPSGGVSLDNVEDWLKAGAIAVGAGGVLTAGARTGDYERIAQTARQFIERISQARNGLTKQIGR